MNTLMPKSLIAKAPKLYSTQELGANAIVIAHWFTPFSNWDWYMTEYDPEEDLAFGYVKGFVGEFGYFTIRELAEVNAQQEIDLIERDKYWTPCKLGEIVDRNFWSMK